MAWKFFNNFTAGEWTPKLDGRSDLQKYDSACRRLENMRVMPYGGARFRAGFELVASAKYADKAARLMPFVYSTEQRFVLEWGEYYLRVYSMAGELLQEVETPYAGEDVLAVQCRQINDVVYLVHRDYPVQKLARYADDDWRLAEVDWSFPAMLDENVSDTTLQLSAITGTGVVMTASASLFEPAHVGSYWELRHLKEAGSVSVTMAAASGTFTSPTIKVQGDWNCVTTERWYGTLSVERSLDGGSSWETVREFVGASDRNVSASGTQGELALMRMTYEASGNPFGAGVWVGTPPTAYVLSRATLETADAYVSGLVKVTGYTDATHVTVTVIQEAAGTAATEVWSESAWSAVRGFPQAVGFFEQRLILAASRHQPNTVWGSVTDDFENFRYDDDDDAALGYTFAASEQNDVQWIDSFQRIQAATSAREFTVAAGNADEPLTPSNIVVRSESANGSAHLQPALVNSAILYVARQGRRVQEMAYSIERDGYASVDLTLLAEHVTGSGVVQLAFARQPDPVLFVVRADGELAVLTYDRDQDVVAWSRWVTNGAFESVVVVPGTPADDVWAVVKRGSARFVERLAPESDDKTEGVWLDAAVVLDAGDTTLTVVADSSLAHLNTRTVTVVADGRVYAGLTVASSSITLPEPIPHASRVVVGLPYQGVLQPMKLDVVLADGPSQGRVRRISEITPRFYASLGCKFGPSLAALEEVPFRTTWDDMDASPPEFTGDVRCVWVGGHDKAGDFVIVQDQPFPFTLLGIAVKWEVFGG